MTFEQITTESKERDRLEGLWWAMVIIWAGLVLCAESMEILPQIAAGDAWSWIFLGAGALATLGNVYRVTSAHVVNPSAWNWVWGGIFLILGIGGFTALNISWALILILVGGALLVGLLRSSE